MQASFLAIDHRGKNVLDQTPPDNIPNKMIKQTEKSTLCTRLAVEVGEGVVEGDKEEGDGVATGTLSTGCKVNEVATFISL